MIKTSQLLFVLTFIFSNIAFAELFQVDLKEDVRSEMLQRNYAFFSHATSNWDRTKGSFQGTRNLYDFAKRKQISVLVSVHGDALRYEDSANEYYIKNSEADQVLHSEAGQHKLEFPNLDNVYFSGGNLTLCLCEAIRDVARGTQKLQSTNLIVVTDAVYDWTKNVKTEAAAIEYVKNFIVPHFFCPDQNWKNYPELELKDAALQVYFGEKSLGKFDLNPSDANNIESLSRVINLKFVSSKELL